MDKNKNIINKIKVFLATAGFTKLFYLVLGIVFVFLGLHIFAGAAFGIFVYININVFIKLITSKLE